MQLKGKYLIRKSKTKKGQKVITITGVFYPDEDFPELHENDEMWVSVININGEVKRFKDLRHGYVSPEEFLEGRGMKPEDWKQTQTQKFM